MKLNLQPNAQVIKASDTDHMTEKESVEGKLVLTNQKRLYFKLQNEALIAFDRILTTKKIKHVTKPTQQSNLQNLATLKPNDLET